MKRLALFSAALLAALFGWMAASASRDNGVTADEIFHVTAGVSYWKFGDYRLQPENGNLPQRWAALPLLTRDLHFPATDQPAWRNADAAEIGHQFLHESGNDLPHLLASARAMIALLGVACAALVWAWSRSLFGLRGALVSVALFAFCPLLLAHGGLATSDMAATLGFLASTLTGWRLLHRITLARIVLAGLAWGGLALAKFSAPVFAFIFVLMLVARFARGARLPVKLGKHPHRLRGARAFGAVLVATGAGLALALATIWAAYGFRFNGLLGPGTYNHPWSDYGGRLAVRVAEFARSAHLLPDAWLQGFAHTAHFADGRPAFFLGEYRTQGWPLFFPVGFLVKTTLPALALLVAAAAALPRVARRHGRLYRLVPLVALLAAYGVFAVTSHLNIGVRHILPMYPALYILAGAVAAFPRRPLPLAFVGVLLACHAGESLRIRPHYLAYFNSLLGGPARAYRSFVDSSLDWGQDLPGLKRFLDQQDSQQPVFLSYFGSDSPAHEGIRATRIADGYFDLRARQVAPPMTGGTYCISATMFQQVYTLVRHGWTPEHERRYETLRSWNDAWRTGRTSTPTETAQQWLIELEHLRFGRLCAALQRRAPDAEIGYSILIFRLTDADVRTFLEGPPPYYP